MHRQQMAAGTVRSMSASTGIHAALLVMVRVPDDGAYISRSPWTVGGIFVGQLDAFDR